MEARAEIMEDTVPCRKIPTASTVIPPGEEDEIQELKNKLLTNARLKMDQAPVKEIDFEIAKEFQRNRPSLKSLKAHLRYVKCGSVEWQREDTRVSKEIFHATWMFNEKSQTLVVERRYMYPTTVDRYRLLVPFRAILGLRFNISTDTIAAHLKRLSGLQAQVIQKDQSTWETHEDYSSLSSRKTGREIVSLTLQFLPDKTSLSEMEKQFERQPNLARALNVGIKPDFDYGNAEISCEFNDQELHKNMPIVLDPTLVRAAQVADIELLNEAKEKGNDVRYLVKMYFGLEESFNELLRSRVRSAMASTSLNTT